MFQDKDIKGGHIKSDAYTKLKGMINTSDVKMSLQNDLVKLLLNNYCMPAPLMGLYDGKQDRLGLYPQTDFSQILRLLDQHSMKLHV